MLFSGNFQEDYLSYDPSSCKTQPIVICWFSLMGLDIKPVQTGIETLIHERPQMLRGRPLGLLANPASVDPRFNASSSLIHHHFPDQLRVLFGPQHGYFAEKQDNMVPSGDFIDPAFNIPVFSLYGKTRMPTERMFEQIDTLIIDLQDVGTRVYTFISTMALSMEAAVTDGKQIVVLDRPNPLGGNAVEGNPLEPGYASFVGMYPIPMRHGLTIGEMALLLNNHFGIGCDLTVVPMKGWRRDMLFQDTGLPWIAPSPNLPTPTSALVYPGQVLWEGTNVSEGRGTTKPFEIFGAPFLDTVGLKRRLSSQDFPGVHLRSLAFEPTSNKWAGQLCHGFQLHILEPRRYRPYIVTLTMLSAVASLHPEEFQWKPPPYEYEFEKLPFDLITGDPGVRKAVEAMVPREDMEAAWQDDLKTFEELRGDCLIYR